MARAMTTRVFRGTIDLHALRALVRKLRDTGFTAQLRALDYDELKACGGRGLVPVKLSSFGAHMVAVLGVDDDSIAVIDPRVGPYRLSRAAFERIWLGRALLVVRASPAPAEAVAARR